MSKSRLELQTLLEQLVGPDVDVWFQEPENLKLSYPCVIFHRDSGISAHADNKPYRHTTRYQLTVIDYDPDSIYPGLIETLPMCTFQRWFVKDRLNHNIYQLYF